MPNRKMSYAIVIDMRIYLWTGNGAGKTTSALGTAMRALGHGKKVVMVQWLKGRKNIGELKFARHLENFKIYQFGRPDFIDLKKPKEIDYRLAKDAVKFTAEIVKKEKPFLVILDEFALAMAAGLVSMDDLKEILKSAPKQTIIYITGRYAPRPLRALCDYVTEINVRKMPKKLPKAIAGIEY